MKAIQRGDSLYLENVGGCDWIAAFRNAPQAHEVGNIINQHEALVASNNELRGQVQQLVAALKAARLLIDPTAPTTVPREEVLKQIDAARAAAGQ